MAFIDILILAAVALGAVLGFRRGLTGGLASVAGIVLGVVACRLLGDAAYGALCRNTGVSEWPGAPYTGMVIAYAAIYVVVWVACLFAGMAAGGLLKAVRLGGLNRAGGAAFGALKWLLAVSLLLNLGYTVAPESPLYHSSHLLDGALLRFAMDLAPALWGLGTTANLG